MKNILIREYAKIKREQLKNNPYSCLSDSKIDINPHQIEAFTHAISSLENGGVILADEVGLGKTIEAGLVIKYCLSNKKNRILLIMPSSLRKQWQVELDNKFGISSMVVDSQSIDEYRNLVNQSSYNPVIIIVSYNFFARRADIFSLMDWDLVVFDEAHKLRSVYKSNSKIAKKIYETTKEIPKIMLTATPVQNTLFDIYGLVNFIDEKIFFNKTIFSKRFVKEDDFDELKEKIKPILQRTLREDVADYLSFKKRICITVDFKLSYKEAVLYKLVNDYLKRDILYAIPMSSRNLITVIIRKLLASSSYAVTDTFQVLMDRLITLKESTKVESINKSLDYFFHFLDDEDEELDSNADELYDRERVNQFIQTEIDLVDKIIKYSREIKESSKAEALLDALELSFKKQNELGINEKVVIFTESIRTQKFLKDFLSKNGYDNEILLFNGNSSDKKMKEIYKAWKSMNYGKYIGSRNVEIKHAIVDFFKAECKILILTDAGSEGLNLQFCNTVINYDLPWNPQKIEQRIGRCHRYGQKNDVMVINLLNTENIADRRVYEILSHKFMLFEGVFGASDEALGLLESGVDFEKRIMQIYQNCNTTGQFNNEFKKLEREFERKRNVKFHKLKELLTIDSKMKSKMLKETLDGINQYFKDEKEWNSFQLPKDKLTFPIAFKVNDKSELGTNHGYIFIGALYDEKQKFLEPVLVAYDSNSNNMELTEVELVNIINKIKNHQLQIIEIKNDEVKLCEDKIYDEAKKKILDKYKKIIDYNNSKIENWAQLRKENYGFEIEELEAEIKELIIKSKSSKKFKEKIDIKRKIERKQREKDSVMINFHQEISKIDKESNKMIKEFNNQFEVNPILFIKIIVKF